VTGGAGFIGSNFLNLYVKKYPEIQFLNFDKLTYAGDLHNIQVTDNSNYEFYQGDISNLQEVHQVLNQFRPEIVVNFAAESHVDQSIANPSKFMDTNIQGTFHLIDEFRKLWTGNYVGKRFHHISTDEVYGYLGKDGYFTEDTPYDPSSPYAASKAASDHIVRAYGRTYGVPISISNCSNNFGPFQHDEKMVPTIIRKALNGQKIPVYGTGENVRDWIFVTDHCQAIWRIIFNGEDCSSFNIGAHHDISNNLLITDVLEQLSLITGQPVEAYKRLITFVQDRKGHDYRYAIDPTKIEEALNWHPDIEFNTGLEETVRFYVKKYCGNHI